MYRSEAGKVNSNAAEDRHSGTSQETWIFSNTTVRTSSLAPRSLHFLRHFLFIYCNDSRLLLLCMGDETLFF